MSSGSFRSNVEGNEARADEGCPPKGPGQSGATSAQPPGKLQGTLGPARAAEGELRQPMEETAAARAATEAERARLLARMTKTRQYAAELTAALECERDILQAIMDNTRTHLAYLDSQFRFVRVNNAYVQGCGHSREVLLGRNHFELFPDPENEAIFARVRDTGQPVEFRARPFAYADQPERGTTYWDWTLMPVKDGKGQVQGLVLSLADVTEQKRAEEERRWELAVRKATAELSSALIDASASVERIANIVLAGAKHLTKSEHGYVSSIDPETRDSVAHTLTSMMGDQCLVPDGDRRIAFPVGPDGRYPGLWGHSLNTREAFFTNSPDMHAASRGMPEGHIALRNFLSVPAVVDEEVVGQVSLANSECGYTERELDAVKRLTELYSLALHRKRVEDKVESLARFPAENMNPVLRVGLDGTVLYANDAGRTFLREWERAVGSEAPSAWGDRVADALGSRTETTAEFECAGRVYSFAIMPVADAGYANLYGSDITERRRAEEALKLHEVTREVLLDLNKMTDASRQQILDYVLEAVIRVSQSRFAFLGFVNDDESEMTIYAWSAEAMAQCAVRDAPMCFSIREAGLWGEVVRQRCPVVVNDYAASHPRKRGYPEGHVAIMRFLGVPVFDGDRIVAVAAVANKEKDYDESDVRAIASVMNDMWRLVRRKQTEEVLARQAEELARSNRELEQFAYVVSHDLQEPLRMVASFTQLLKKRYSGRIGADADDFIGYAVDGARRMQALIDGLLAYSRAGRGDEAFEPTDCRAVLQRVLSNLHVAIEESGAVVTHDPLPIVLADHLQLGQLLQNLISNGIKFRGERPPRVHVSAEPKENEWVFSVRDNGIGMDAKFADRIFDLFQRLHGRREYPGTGVGLAICKKIVERHNGRIGVESQPGRGSVFHFTIPKRQEQQP